MPEGLTPRTSKVPKVCPNHEEAGLTYLCSQPPACCAQNCDAHQQHWRDWGCPSQTARPRGCRSDTGRPAHTGPGGSGPACHGCAAAGLSPGRRQGGEGGAQLTLKTGLRAGKTEGCLGEGRKPCHRVQPGCHQRLGCQVPSRCHHCCYPCCRGTRGYSGRASRHLRVEGSTSPLQISHPPWPHLCFLHCHKQTPGPSVILQAEGTGWGR